MQHHPTDSPAFVGRTGELALIASCLEGAAAGLPAVVWLEGEAGSGKTVLLREVVRTLPADVTLVRGEADELNAQAAFSLASQLGVAASGDPFAVGMELLSHLGALQDAGPVLVVVEDLHWADPASRLTLLTVARHLDEDRVLMLMSSRPGPGPGDGWERLCQDTDRCRFVRLGALGVEDVAEMARRAGVPLTAAAAGRLHRHTGGHPLYVRTLLNELTPEQLATSHAELPAPRSLASTTTARLAELPQSSRTLAAALAVVNGRVSLPLAGKVAGLAHPAPALEELLSTGFVTWWSGEPGTPIEFAHPLYRAAVYDDLSPTVRQQLHRAAAEALGGDAALAHRVAAADAVDEDLAGEVAAAGRRQQERGALGQAATHLLWASSLTAQPQQHEEWLLHSARLLLRDGQTGRAASLEEDLRGCGDQPLRSLVFGMLAWDRGDADAAAQWLARAGDATSPREIRAEALALLGMVRTSQIHGEEAGIAARDALSLRPVDPVVEQNAWTALSLGRAMLHGAPAGLEQLEERLPGAPGEIPPGDAELLIVRGTLAFFAGCYSASIADLRAAIHLVTRGATAAQLPRAHVHLAQGLFEIGDWDESLIHARIALSLTAGFRTTWVEAQAHAAAGTVLASRGEWEAAREQIDRARQAAQELGTIEAVSSVRVTEAALCRARGDAEGVVESLMVTDDITTIPMIASLTSYPSLILGLLDLGDVEGAEHQLTLFEHGAAARCLHPQARILGTRAALAAATGRSSEAEENFRQAIRLFDADDPLLDRADLHRQYGRLLRDRGNRKGAVEQLRTAHELLAAAAAEPFRQRVADELEGCGVPTGTQRTRGSLSLTDREHDVVALVAKGLTNREVATELYVSPKAVEYHLRNVFAKLGISSRRELRNLSLASRA